MRNLLLCVAALAASLTAQARTVQATSYGSGCNGGLLAVLPSKPGTLRLEAASIFYATQGVIGFGVFPLHQPLPLTSGCSLLTYPFWVVPASAPLTLPLSIPKGSVYYAQGALRIVEHPLPLYAYTNGLRLEVR